MTSTGNFHTYSSWYSSWPYGNASCHPGLAVASYCLMDILALYTRFHTLYFHGSQWVELNMILETKKVNNMSNIFTQIPILYKHSNGINREQHWMPSLMPVVVLPHTYILLYHIHICFL